MPSFPKQLPQLPRNPVDPFPSSPVCCLKTSFFFLEHWSIDWFLTTSDVWYPQCFDISKILSPLIDKNTRCRSLDESTSSERAAPSDTASLGLPPPPVKELLNLLIYYLSDGYAFWYGGIPCSCVGLSKQHNVYIRVRGRDRNVYMYTAHLWKKAVAGEKCETSFFVFLDSC